MRIKRSRAKCFAIEKSYCRGFVVYGFGLTRADALAALKAKTAGYYHVDLDNVDYRDYQ